MVSAGLIAPLLGETGAHTRDSLVRVAVGIGDVEVWQRAFDFLSFTNSPGRKLGRAARVWQSVPASSAFLASS